MADPFYTAEPPTRSPRRGGIRSVAEFRTDNRIGLGGKIVYVSPGCSMTQRTAALCYPTGQTQGEKQYEDVPEFENVIGVAGMYHGVQCWLDGEDYEARAREGLERSEDRQIESYLGEWVGSIPASADFATLTGAIAAADADADESYPGGPTLIMNRADVVKAVAEDALSADRDGNVWTANGTPVLSSSMFSSGEVTVTGAITVIITDVYVTRTRDLELNIEMAIAERSYGVLIDCNYAKRFTVTPVTP